MLWIFKNCSFGHIGDDRHHRDGVQGREEGPWSRHLPQGLLDKISILEQLSDFGVSCLFIVLKATDSYFAEHPRKIKLLIQNLFSIHFSMVDQDEGDFYRKLNTL